MGIWIRSTVAVLIGLMIVLPSASSAETGRMRWMNQMLPTYERDLATATSVLTSKDREEWTQEDIEFYLFNAMCVVYGSMVIYIDTHDTLPGGSADLRNEGIAKEWPANPFNNWEPIGWESTEFVPGDCVVQICPPELYSGIWNPRPMTFAISINGPSEDYSPLSSVSKHYDWTYLPAGTVFMTGAGRVPATKARETMEASKQRQQEEADAENGDVSQEDSQ